MDAMVKEVGGVAAPPISPEPGPGQSDGFFLGGDLGTDRNLDLQCGLHDDGSIPEHPVDDWWKVVDTNLTGAFHLVQEVLPSMRALGAGRIVIVSSYWGVIGWPNATAYAASKAGLVALVKTLGRELAPEGIIVNGIAPWRDLDAAARDRRRGRWGWRVRNRSGLCPAQSSGPRCPAGRDRAGVAFLADRRMGAMVGTILQMNGGEVRGRV